MMKKKCIVICGATASGKTAISLQLANHFSTSILSFDSRQCYKELNIGVAKPTPEELGIIEHYFINTHSIQEYVNAVSFEEYGLQVLGKIFSKNDVAVLVGGTGLYLQALLEGLDDIPAVPYEIREKVNELFSSGGLEGLKREIIKVDPGYLSSVDLSNPRRIMRALEVYYLTGRPYSTFIRGQKKERDFDTYLFAPDVPRPELYLRINNRVDIMIQEGLEGEAASLAEFRALPALQTVGYSEWFRHFDGIYDREQAIYEIKKNTRHYAKRQLTWFKRMNGIRWIPPGSDIISLVEDALKFDA